MKQSNDELINEAATVTKSDNPLVHALWNVQGVAIWYRTGGRRGLSLEQAQATLLSNIAAHTEQAVLAARIDELQRACALNAGVAESR